MSHFNDFFGRLIITFKTFSNLSHFLCSAVATKNLFHKTLHFTFLLVFVSTFSISLLFYFTSPLPVYPLPLHAILSQAPFPRMLEHGGGDFLPPVFPPPPSVPVYTPLSLPPPLPR